MYVCVYVCVWTRVCVYVCVCVCVCYVCVWTRVCVGINQKRSAKEKQAANSFHVVKGKSAKSQSAHGAGGKKDKGAKHPSKPYVCLHDGKEHNLA